MASVYTWNNLSPNQSNWQALGAGGMFGTFTYGGGGVPVARDHLDQMRLGTGQVPHANYPDGYLGTIKSRRDDRGRPTSEADTLLDSIKSRVTQKSYQRGVHRGERIEPSDYYWPKGLEPDRGLRNQAKGRKTAPLLDRAPVPHLVNNGKAFTPNTVPGEVNPVRNEQLSRLRPSWR